MAKRVTVVTEPFLRGICLRMAAGQRIRRMLPAWGRIHIDRPLPFVCLYRRPPGREDPGTDRLVTGEASYVTALGAHALRPGLRTLTDAVTGVLIEQFGACLLLEVWAGERDAGADVQEPGVRRPAFVIKTLTDDSLAPAVDALKESLGRIAVAKRSAEVRVTETNVWWPTGLGRPITRSNAAAEHCYALGLEVAPIYRDADGGEVYPLVLRELRRSLGRALRRLFYDFARTCTTHRPTHYHVLGRRAVVKAVWTVDRRLAEVADMFDFLLQISPTNAKQAWNVFRRSHFETAPVLRYPPLLCAPSLLKRQLYASPVERIEDPALAYLFREKQMELDRQVTMLLDLNTPRFLLGSIQLYGGVEGNLLDLAMDLLKRLPSPTREGRSVALVRAEGIASRAREELESYRSGCSDIRADIQIRDDIMSGLMVSRGSLLIGRHTVIAASRLEALIQHEIGTHALTYFNGKAQPFRQLHAGLAGCEATQEGLAVLGEYLVGGLDVQRLRVLAGRVVAVHCLSGGATFVETFRRLGEEFRFDQQTAFALVMRVFRGGGLTKDAVYLRGFVQVLQHLALGGALDELFIGKIALEHLPVVRELRWREVLRQPPLAPRYVTRPEVSDRLRRVQEGVSVLDLIEEGNL